MFRFFLPLALLLSACQSMDVAPRPMPPNSGPLSYAQCAQIGGEWRRGGMLGTEQCFYAPRDAGQICNASTECEGMCELNTARNGGTCSAEVPVFGCVPLFENGQSVTICID